MMNYLNSKRAAYAATILLVLLVGTQAARRPTDSVSRLLRGYKQASNLPPPITAEPTARRLRRRLAWLGGMGIANSATVKHDFRAFWKHLAAGWGEGRVWPGSQYGMQKYKMKQWLREGGGPRDMNVSVGRTDAKTDLMQLKDNIKGSDAFKSGALRGILREIMDAIVTLQILTKRLNGRRRRLASATTKTLKNYLRAIHMFLFCNVKRVDEIGKTQKKSDAGGDFDQYTNLAGLEFTGEGVLTQMFKRIIASTNEVRKQLDRQGKPTN